SIEKMYKYPVDVAGTHGKTSTTGMLSHIFIAADKNPTILIGGELPVINGNMHIGGDEYFISESCEYHCSFLDFSPYISVILNVDADHLDYFKDIEEIKQAFGKFASIASGAVVINADDKNTVDAVGSIEKPIITTSAKAEADFYAKNISCNGFSEYSFDVYGQSGYINHIELSVPGVHHVNNALCAYAAAATLGVDAESIAKGLKSFTGVKRRFELKCEQNGIRIYDDYAHHPTEIAATLQTLKNFTANERYIIFQPHTYTRTYALLGDFIKALSGVGTIIVLPIYAAREKDTGKISGKDIAEKIEGAYYAESFEDAADYILPRLKKGDIVMTMGAGDVYKTGDILINKIKNC
ncbi:MAG: UDP-N-acetylmuramate--L-alanine ligase, partial [Bacillota bacterium]|nr:UDP-N-acetylmuramate--L-alanine ligase [Bacillota bacterium]